MEYEERQDEDVVDPLFSLLSICPIRYSFSTPQWFAGAPLLVI